MSRITHFDTRPKPRSRQALFIVLAILIFCGLYLGFRVYRFYQGIKKPSRALIVTKTPEEKNTYNLLILGYGGGNHDGTYLTDTIMVIHADTQKKKAELISIPRDIYIRVPTKDKTENLHFKINELYEMGLFPKDFPAIDTKYLAGGDSAGLIKYAILQITGFPVDAYVSIDFDGFIKAIDVLGGVDVTVDRTFDDYEYPIDGHEKDLCGKDAEFTQIEPIINGTMSEEDKNKLFSDKPELAQFYDDIKNNPVVAFPCRYEKLHFDAGPAHMDGATALKFARSRHSLTDGGDFNRAKRQQKILEAVKDKALSLGGITKMLTLMDEMQPYLKTDMPEEDIRRLLPEVTNVREYSTVPLVITEPTYVHSDYSPIGQFILVPNKGLDNWSAVKTDIKNIMLGITPTPTPLPVTKTVNK